MGQPAMRVGRKYVGLFDKLRDRIRSGASTSSATDEGQVQGTLKVLRVQQTLQKQHFISISPITFANFAGNYFFRSKNEKQDLPIGTFGMLCSIRHIWIQHHSM
jgi:hypothetical protein